MKIREIISEKSVAIRLEVKDKTDLINKMAELANESGKIIDLNEVKEKLFARENLMSTSVGNGIALPHAKLNKVKKTVGSIATLSNPIEYDSLDGKPVNIVLMLVGRENNIGDYLKLLSEISKIFGKSSFVDNILKATTSGEVLDIFDKDPDQ